MLYRSLIALMLTTLIATGCSQAPDDGSGAGTDPESTSTPAEATEEVAAEPAGPTLPEALAGLVEIHEDYILTKVEVVDEAAKQYHIEFETKQNVDKVQSYYMGAYGAKGWDEDMNMSQKGNTTTSYVSEDGFMIFIDAHKGGPGSTVSIDTGMV
jgi:hypothetical protein